LSIFRPCGSFDPIGSHPTDPRAKYRSYFPADMLPAWSNEERSEMANRMANKLSWTRQFQ